MHPASVRPTIRLSAISAMLTWAIERGHIAANHLRGFKRLYHADRSEIIWLPEHIAAFMQCGTDRAAAGADPRPALRVSGKAISCGLPWSAYDGSTITLRQGKARRGRPARAAGRSCHALPLCVACSTEWNEVSPLILTTKTGQSFKKRYFARLWEDLTRKAGLEFLTPARF